MFLPILTASYNSGDSLGKTTRTRIQHESQLRHKLFEHYDRRVRPSGNITDTVSVYVSMRLLHIEGVVRAISNTNSKFLQAGFFVSQFVFAQEEQRQVLKIHTWMAFRWNDVRLNWNSPDYANLTVLHTADEELWRPDISLYNKYDVKSWEEKKHLLCS